MTNNLKNVPIFEKGYCDLNIPHAGDLNILESCLNRAFELGYDTLAVNVTVKQEQMQMSAKGPKNKKQKRDSEEAEESFLDFPIPPKLPFDRKKVLNRLTIHFNDNNFLPFFNKSDTIKQYDIISVCPTSAEALRNLLKAGFRADIVSFDPEFPKDTRWSRKLYMDCVEKNLFFELCYSPMIRDTTLRRRIISQGHNYHTFGKSKHIILSSGALTCLELRSPYDVANLGFLLGLNEHTGKLSVGVTPRGTLKAAKGRRLGPYRAVVENVSDVKEEDKWKVPQNPDFISL